MKKTIGQSYRDELIRAVIMDTPSENTSTKSAVSILVNKIGIVTFIDEVSICYLNENLNSGLKPGDSLFEIIPTKEIVSFGGKLNSTFIGKTVQGNFTSLNGVKTYYHSQPLFDSKGIVNGARLEFYLDDGPTTINELNEQLPTLLANSSIGVFLGRSNGALIDCNKSALEMFGYEPSEIKLLNRNNLFKLDDNFKKLLEDREIYGEINGEVTGIKKGGCEFPIQIFSSIYNTTKEENFSSTLLIDLSQQKIHEHELTRTRQIFESLFQHHPDAIYSMDKNGNFINFNQSAIKLSEGTADRFGESQFVDLLPKEEHDRVFKKFEAALSGNVVNYKTKILSFKGNQRLIEITNFPIKHNSEISGVFGVAKDITLLENSKNTILKSEQKVRNLLEQSLDLICTIDDQGRLTDVGAASFSILGYLPEEMSGKTYESFVAPEDVEKSIEACHQVRKGVELKNYYNSFVHKDGRKIPLVWSIKWVESEAISYAIAKDASLILRAEEKLVKERNMLKAIIDNIPDYIFVKDLDSKSILSNKSFNEGILAETDLSKTLGLKPSHYFGREMGAKLERDNRRVIQSGIPVINRQEIAITSDGKEEVVLLTKVPMRDQNNTVIGLVGIARKITEKVKAEEALIKSEKRFKSLVQEGSDLIVIMDKNLTFKYVSPTASPILAMNPEQLAGSNALINIHPDDAEKVISQIKRLETEKRVQIPSFRFKNGHGEYRWIETIVTNLTEDPAVSGYVANSRDITEFIQQKRKLMQSVKRYDTVAKATSDLITDYDFETDTMCYNDAIYGMLGYTEEEIENSSCWWHDKIHPEDRKLVKGVELNLRNKGLQNVQLEYKLRCADGSYKHVLYRSYLVTDDNGHPKRIIASLQDITERINYIRTIEESNEQLKQIAWMQSHVVRAPLAKIMGLVDLLKSEKDYSEISEMILENILTSSRDLDSIIRTISDKAEAAKSTFLKP